MDNPGLLIAVNMILMYLILGPVVLFGFYVVFDNISNLNKKKKKRKDFACMNMKELNFK